MGNEYDREEIKKLIDGLDVDWNPQTRGLKAIAMMMYNKFYALGKQYAVDEKGEQDG